MVIQLKETNPLDFEVGDLLISDTGKSALVVHDDEWEEVRAVLFWKNQISRSHLNNRALINDLSTNECFGNLFKVVKGSNLKLSEI